MSLDQYFHTIIRKYDIQYDNSEPYDHEHNGTAERLNRTIEDRIRALLFTSGFPSSFWGFAAHSAVYLYNRTPHSALNFLTPFQKAFDKPPHLPYVRSFGSRAYVHTPNIPKGSKTQPRATIQYIVGYTNTGYITYSPQTQKRSNCCSVKIDEQIKYKNDYPKTNIDKLVLTRRVTRSSISKASTPTDETTRELEPQNEISNTTENVETENLVEVRDNDTVYPTEETVDNDTETDNDETVIDYDWDDNTTPCNIKKLTLH